MRVNECGKVQKGSGEGETNYRQRSVKRFYGVMRVVCKGLAGLINYQSILDKE